KKFEHEIAAEWVKEQIAPGVIRSNLIREQELRGHCEEFLKLLAEATRKANVTEVSGTEFHPVREMLARISRSRGEQGFSASETATFVFSLKRPLFARLRRELENEPSAMFQELWSATELLDKLGLFTTEVYQKTREAVINRQRDEMLELSTP